MYGVALEGGGAKGAYHVGALKALIENGYEISGIVGTSIGSLNAAVVAQGDFNKLYKLWTSSTSSDLFNIEKEDLNKIVNKKIDISLLKNVTGYVRGAASNKGIDTTKYKELIEKLVDEHKLRKSKVDYGLVTVSWTDKKPLELYKEDMEEGTLLSYIMASSYFPLFKSEKIQDKTFIDGGFYNNCPSNMLINKGYKNIIEIRTKAIGVYKKVKAPKDVNIITIEPSSDLGNILLADNTVINKNIKMGYYDTLRVINKLEGTKYYINGLNKNIAFDIFNNLSDEQIYSIADMLDKKLKNKESKKILFEDIIPYISRKLKLQGSSSYDEFLIGIVEYILSEEELVEVYNVYNLKDLILEIKKNSSNILRKGEFNLVRNVSKEIAIKIIKEISIEKM